VSHWGKGQGAVGRMRGDVKVRDVRVSSAGEWMVCNTVKDLSDEQLGG
jgi:hypothetical protein